MKLGSVEITLNSRKQAEVAVANYVRSDEMRLLVARVARSEVKNYLQTICEEAGISFTSVRDILPQLGVKMPFPHEADYDMTDSPFDGKGCE